MIIFISDWQYGTNLNSFEIRKLQKAFELENARLLDDVAAKKGLNLEDSEDKAIAYNDVKYLKFFEVLKESAKK